MHSFSLGRRLVAEGLGTAFLLAIVIGSGIMGERLAGGNVALALIGNTLATGAGLVVLITVFGPVSGAHFNPAVTLVMLARRAINLKTASFYVAVQCGAAILGVLAAHAMFGEPLFQVSHKLRSGPALAWSEVVATFGLFATIFGVSRFKPESVAVAVGLYITAAYWFTASTSFSNPAVTMARSLSDTFAGIAPASVPAFVMAQLIGAAIATALFGWLFKDDGERFNSDPTGTPAGPPSDTERSAPIADQRPRQADALS
jgi:glycerol uptake facilitator-like aquaporin